MLAEFVWDASMLEGNPFTFPEVKTLLEGITVGGRKITDQAQILNLAEASKQLLGMIRANTFILNKPVFCELHQLVAQNEALEWGHFRGEGKEKSFTPHVVLGEFESHIPPLTQEGGLNLHKIFLEGLTVIREIEKPIERAFVFFLFAALQQFFFDGNKRTARFMMNGLLMSHGMDAISVPAAKALEFNEKMVQFYVNRNGTDMIKFLLNC